MTIYEEVPLASIERLIDMQENWILKAREARSQQSWNREPEAELRYIERMLITKLVRFYRQNSPAIGLQLEAKA